MSYQLRPAYPQAEEQQQYHGEYHGEVYQLQLQQPAYHHPPVYYSTNPYPHPPPPPPPPPQPIPGGYYDHEDYTRTQGWVANQPAIMSPPPPTKTPLTEYSAGSSWDRQTTIAPSMILPPRDGDSQRVCGLKRTLFFIIFAIGFLLLVTSIAVGLGVGLSARNLNGDANAGDPSSTVSPSPSLTPTSPTPMPSFTGTLVSAPVICPQNDKGVYLSQGSSKPFNIECGNDYNSNGGAQELAHFETETMADCINACGSTDGCIGAGWGNFGGSYVCWLKSRLGTPNSSPQWYFARLQDKT